MKRIISLLLCLIMLFAMTSCKPQTEETQAVQPPYATEGWEYEYVFPVGEGLVGTTKPKYNDVAGNWVCDKYSIVLDDSWEPKQVDMEVGGGWALYNADSDVSLGVNIFDTGFPKEEFTADKIRQGMEADFGEYITISSCEEMSINGHDGVYLRAFVEEELQTWLILFVNCDTVTYKFTLAMPFDDIDTEETVARALQTGLRLDPPTEEELNESSVVEEGFASLPN